MIKTIIYIALPFLFAQISLAGGNTISVIPLIQKHSHFYLEASVNGTKGLFILDTGANMGALDLEFAKKAGAYFMDESGKLSLSVSTALIESGTISIYVSTLTIKRLELYDQAMMWSNTLNIKEQSLKYDGVAADGLISLRNLEEQVFAIDYKGKKLTFLKQSPKTTSKSAVLKMDKSCLSKAKVCLNLSRNGLTGTFLLDSGASSLLVPRKFADNWGIYKSTTTRAKEWNGVAGKEYLFEDFTFDELKLGRVSFFVPDSDSDDYGLIEEGLIGNNVLEHFSTITYDMPNAELILGGQ